MTIYDNPEFMCDCCGATSFPEFRWERGDCACGGTIVPCKTCKSCGVLYNTEESVIFSSICNDCYNAGKTVANAIKYSKKWGYTNPVQVSDLADRLLGQERINQILYEYILSHYTDGDETISKYLGANSLAAAISFASFLEEENYDTN